MDGEREPNESMMSACLNDDDDDDDDFFGVMEADFD